MKPSAAVPLACGFMLLAAACGATGTAPAAPSATSSRAAASGAGRSGAATASAGAAATGDAGTRALLAALPAEPAGGRRLTDRPVGILTLQQYVDVAIQAAGRQNALALERGRGLEYAARNAWTTSTGDVVDVMLVRYPSHDAAESALRGLEAGTRKQRPDWSFAPLTGPEGWSMTDRTMDSGGFRHVFLHAVSGSVLDYVYIASPAAVDRTAATALLRQENAGVCARLGCS